ncbi:helix-turn-helix domain-containing protein [Massilia pinisoli]
MATVTARIGADRKKINEILKMELGLTFTGYVNTLRLTEAARLLQDRQGTPIAEIAYSVGYTSISHFNKVFKEEYGCTPGVFRRLATQRAASPEPAPAGPPDPPLDTA